MTQQTLYNLLSRIQIIQIVVSHYVTLDICHISLRGSHLGTDYKCKSAHCQIFLPICDIHSCNKKDERWFLGTVLASPYFWIENYKPYFETALLLVYIDLWHQIEKWLSL